MFTMGQKIKDQNTDFYLSELCANDYYSEDEKTEGHWFGKLAEHWNIQDHPVTNDDFQSIMQHRCPWDRGTPLTTLRNKDGVSFFPFQCSAQKSVSIMAVVAGDNRLTEAHRECVKLALAELEKFAAHRLRTGENHGTEKTQLTGNILAAVYHHDASRALDPQLHTHCVIANCTMTQDGHRMALTESQMMKAVEYAGRYYQSAMARRCMELGYKIAVKSGRHGIEGFEIEGVGDDLLRRYSRRREEIEAEIEKFQQSHGRDPSTAEVQIITLNTREAKLKEISTPEVRAQQRDMLTKEELRQLVAIRRHAVSSVRKELASGEKIKIITGALESLYERKSVVPRHELYSEALKCGMGHLSRADIDQVIDRCLVKLSDGENGLLALYTTPQWQELETQAVKIVQDGIEKFEPYGKPVQLSKLKLSEDQRQAVEGVLTSRDFAVIVRGAAGAGKTTALRVLDAGLQAAGKDVIYLAPTRGAVNVLKEDGFKNATTAAAFLFRPPVLGKNSVIVIDEGSLISNATGIRLLSQARKAGARIVINGDEKQHTSVDAGDFMRMLEKSCNIRKYELLEIKRQIPENYRQAIRAMAEGRTFEGLELLRAMGAVTEAKADYLTRAAAFYTDNVIAGRKTMLVTPTHAEIDAMTSLIRDKLLAAGKLDAQDVQVRKTFCDFGYTKSQLAATALYKPGMAVRFNLMIGSDAAGSIRTVRAVHGDKITFDDGSVRRATALKHCVSLGEIRNIEIACGEKLLITANDKKAGLTNGDVVEVRETDKDGILLTNGKRIPILFDSFSYGYATTSHKSQGATTGEVILAAASLSDKACYVGSSRGRESVKLVCPEFGPLLHSVKRNTDRMTVREAEVQGIELKKERLEERKMT